MEKQALNTINCIVKSNNPRIRETVPSLLVISDDSYGVSSYAKEYGKIIDETVLQIKGKEIYIELVFPKDNEKEENLFFSSPQRVACIRNRFYGSILISLCEFAGQDLLKSDSWKRLKEFIEQNKRNTYFVLHVLSDFKAVEQLASELKECLNIIEVRLDKPNVEASMRYTVDELSKMGILIDEEYIDVFKEKVIEKVVHKNSYMGYKSLDSLVRRIGYELILEQGNNQDIVGNEVIEKVAKDYEAEKLTYMNQGIGFHM